MYAPRAHSRKRPHYYFWYSRTVWLGLKPERRLEEVVALALGRCATTCSPLYHSCRPRRQSHHHLCRQSQLGNRHDIWTRQHPAELANNDTLIVMARKNLCLLVKRMVKSALLLSLFAQCFVSAPCGHCSRWNGDLPQNSLWDKYIYINFVRDDESTLLPRTRNQS